MPAVRTTISPRPVLRLGGGKLGLGVRHSLFPTLTLGAPWRGCQLPDAILRGQRSCRPHSRAVQRLAALNHRVRPLGSLGLAFADAGLRTGWRHVCDHGSASPPFCSGSATAFGGALARCHGSDLLTLGLLFAHKPAPPFVASPAFWKPSQTMPGPAVLPGGSTRFVPPFGVFRPGWRPGGPLFPCWSTVATVTLRVTAIPPGPKPAWNTWLGAEPFRVPGRSVPFRVTDGARTPPEEPVNCASGLRSLRNGLRGVGPTSRIQPFPSCLGLSWISRNILASAAGIRVLSMNWPEPSRTWENV